MKGMRITKNTLENLYELLKHEEAYSDYLRIDPNHEYTKQADDERRFRAFILMSHLTNELCNMGLFDDHSRFKIIDMLDDVIIRKVKK